MTVHVDHPDKDFDDALNGSESRSSPAPPNFEPEHQNEEKRQPNFTLSRLISSPIRSRPQFFPVSQLRQQFNTYRLDHGERHEGFWGEFLSTSDTNEEVEEERRKFRRFVAFLWAFVIIMAMVASISVVVIRQTQRPAMSIPSTKVGLSNGSKVHPPPRTSSGTSTLPPSTGALSSLSDPPSASDPSEPPKEIPSSSPSISLQPTSHPSIPPTTSKSCFCEVASGKNSSAILGEIEGEKYKCTSASAASKYSSVSICISLHDGMSGISEQIRKVQIQSLNLTHVYTGMRFQVIHPLGKEIEGKVDLADVAVSPWAHVNNNTDQTLLLIHLDELFGFWFDLFMGTMIAVDGRLLIVLGDEEFAFGKSISDTVDGGDDSSIHLNGRGMQAKEGESILRRSDVGRSMNQRSLSGHEIVEEFHLTAEMVQQPSAAPSTSSVPTVDTSSFLTACFCGGSDNDCDMGEKILSQTDEPSLRICLKLNPSYSVPVEMKLTYLRLEGSFPFEAVIGDHISPNVMIESITSETEIQILVINCELIPQYLLEPFTISIFGIAKVIPTISTSSIISTLLFDGHAIETPWSLRFDIIDEPDSMPSILPSTTSKPSSASSVTDIFSCHCDSKNNCIDEGTPMAQDKNSGMLNPTLRICVVANSHMSGEISSILYLQVSQDGSGTSLRIIDNQIVMLPSSDCEVREEVHGSLFVVEIFETAMFYNSMLPPLSEIEVIGTALLNGTSANFTASIPLVIIDSDHPYLPSSRPSTSLFPTHPYSPSNIPSASLLPSKTASPSTLSPSFTPSAIPTNSFQPSATVYPGVFACVCDGATAKCVEKSFSVMDNIFNLCLRARPEGVQLGAIYLLAVSQNKGVSSAAKLIIGNSKIVNEALTRVMYDQNDKRLAQITTILDPIFFENLSSRKESVGSIQGFVSVVTHEMIVDASFVLDFPLITTGTDEASTSPSNEPSMTIPSSAVTSSEKVQVEACQCDDFEGICRLKIITQFDRVVNICFTAYGSSILELKFFSLVHPITNETFNLVLDGAIVDEISTTMVLESSSGMISATLPDEFFNSMFQSDSVSALLDGTSYGITFIQSIHLSQDRDIFNYFSVDLVYFYQSQTGVPTGRRETEPPSNSKTAQPSLEPSISRTYEPSTSAEPTELKNVELVSCVCDLSFKCTQGEIITPDTPSLRVCVVAFPHTAELESIHVLYLENPTSKDVIIIQENIPVDPKSSSVEFVDSRKAIVVTSVPHLFFESIDSIRVSGVGKIHPHGASEIDMFFSTEIDLASHPSDIPSVSPTATPNPSPVDPTSRPTVSRPPSVKPSASFQPSVDQIMDLKICSCNEMDTCTTPYSIPVTVDINDRGIRICLHVFPSNAVIRDLVVMFKIGSTGSTSSPHLDIKLNEGGNFGVISGMLMEDYWKDEKVGTITVYGRVVIFVEGSKKSGHKGFSQVYKLKPITSVPTSSPTMSTMPSGEPPLGVRACLCDNDNECIKDADANIHYNSRSIRICIISTPSLSMLSKLDSLYLESEIINSDSRDQEIATELVVLNDKSAGDDTSILFPNDRMRIVESIVNGDLFRAIEVPTSVAIRGIATVTELDENLFALRSTWNKFSIEVGVIETPSQNPSNNPSTIPTALPIKTTATPTILPTSSPSKKPTGKPTIQPTRQPTKAPTGTPSRAPSAKYN
ncbi:hypothetical protein ACHAXS_005788 [Conticribra weissflogii]